MASTESSAKRPALSTRRSSQRGVAMSLKTRPPRELLKEIGISGKEVVKIIKERRWHIEEPHGLQQERLYYIPEVQDQKLVQRKNFFVGEGELYAFILQQGGLRYLLPEEEFSTEDESEVEVTQPSKPSQEPETSVEAEEESDELSSSSETQETGSEQRRWKRRKKLSTSRGKSVERTTEKGSSTKEKTPAARRKHGKKKAAVADDSDDVRVSPRVKQERATHVGCGQQAEFSEYESSLTARGWRAQLLQDMDVHLLRSVAAVDRRQRALEMSNEGKKKTSRPTEGAGPHVKDEAEILQELEGLVYSIRASQDDLSSMIESIITQGEHSKVPDRIDPVGRIGIPGFVSTGAGSLVLMRDIERYLLLFVAAVRRYQRTRKTVGAAESAGTSSQPSRRPAKRADLRALQLSIEESKRELQELATIIDVEARKETCQNAPPDVQETSQETMQSASRPTDCETDVGTDHDQTSSQQSVASPQRLDGGQWFV